MSLVINSKFILNNHIKEINDFPTAFNPDDIIVYEVIRLINGKVLFLEDHLDRFFTSFQHINKPPLITKEEIINQLKELIKANNISSGNIKFQTVINSQTVDTSFFAFFIPHSYPTKQQYKNGVPVTTAMASRLNPKAKVQQAILREKLNKIIKDKNVYEVIMIHPDGYVTEASRSNLFMIKNDMIFTSPESDILPGITRKYILQLCNDHNYPLFYKRFSAEEMLSMETLFLTGTSPKILPISSISDKIFDVHHPLLRSLMKEFDKVIEKNLENGINFF